MVSTRPSSPITIPLPARSVPRMDAVKASSGTSDRSCTTASSTGSSSKRNSSCRGCTSFGNAQLPCSAIRRCRVASACEGKRACYAIRRKRKGSGRLQLGNDDRFTDGHIHQRGKRGQPRIEIPHDRVVPEVDDCQPSQPCTEESANLV